MSVRVRYAPSPTGLQHIGGIRTALFNYFFARAQGGSFILRIEDTDQGRFSPGALQDIYDTFDWLGIREDEGPRFGGAHGPYVQSERIDRYRAHADDLVRMGAAYPCFCSPERLTKLREEQTAAKSSYQGYDRHCRNLSPEDVSRNLEKGLKPVIRLKVPLEGSTAFDDLILGTIERKNEDINPDPVILKTDGFPTYHLANVIDDHTMGITHIMRAQEWIPSGPLHVLLYRAFGWTPPVYAHLPMVMGSDGQKLSKRHGATAVREFRDGGYLPEAVINYVTMLGWSYDETREFFTRSELETLFDLNRLQKSPAVFDYKKLQWFNGHYIRETRGERLLELLVPYLEHSGRISNPPEEQQLETLRNAIGIAKERLVLLGDINDAIGFLFDKEIVCDPQLLVPKGMSARDTVDVLEAVSVRLSDIVSGSVDDGSSVFHRIAEELGRKPGQVMMPVRIAVTGTKASPPLIESIRLIGPQTAGNRIQTAIRILQNLGDQ